MARGPSTPSLLLALLVAAAAAVTASEASRAPAAIGNWTEELRGAVRRARHGRGYAWRSRSRRRMFENSLGRTPQMGYVHIRTPRRRTSPASVAAEPEIYFFIIREDQSY